MNNRTKPMVLARLVAVLIIPSLALQAADPIPLSLPRPDGKPGIPKKPVEVYLLAGQSNMNGMGDLTGARPPWPSIFLSADHPWHYADWRCLQDNPSVNRNWQIVNGALLLLDGATGTELNRRGVDTGLPMWSANALTTDTGLNVSRQIYLDYLNAGADVLTANTFAYNWCVSPLTPMAVAGVIWAPGNANLGYTPVEYSAELEIYARSLPATYGQDQVQFLYAQPSATLVKGITTPSIRNGKAVTFDAWPKSLKSIAAEMVKAAK